jgi:3-keto-disaccharide hydrolase
MAPTKPSRRAARARGPRLLTALLAAAAIATIATLGSFSAAARIASRSPLPPPALQQAHGDLGYTDTPMLPGGKWHVHDPARPRPKVVTPGTSSTPEQPGLPPSDAVVLFDGKDLSKWNGANGGPAKWKVENGCAEVNGTGDIETKDSFGDLQLHLEWAEPSPPQGESQGRGNSGVYLMQRYEVQVLDCYENLTYPDGQTAAIYGQTPPLVNACRKPGEWQSYDIVFEAPRFDGEKLAKPARVTVFHNGVCVQHDQEILGSTQHRALPAYSAHPAKLPLRLQDHGNPIRYRNVWIRPLGEHDQP